MSNISNKIFNCNGTLVQSNNNKKITGPFGIKEIRVKTKNNKGEEIEVTKIKRSKENLSSFTKRGLENNKRIKKLKSQSKTLHLLYSEERNKSIEKIYKKCENNFGNTDYEKYRLYHHELDEYAIPLKDIEKYFAVS